MTSPPPTIDKPALFVDAPPPPPDLSRSPPPLRCSACTRNPPTIQLVSEVINVEDDGEIEILKDIEEVIAATPEDDNGIETALLAQINAYSAENPINVEYPDDPRNYTEAMAALDAVRWIEGTQEELCSLRDMGVRCTLANTTRQER
ncbi:hypothetical protein B0H13DRAFT_1890341 [Mycena leptocephala]|nr:hypothetical protein B0H13DRAFT_1890341 [Mycena leptocephala]